MKSIPYGRQNITEEDIQAVIDVLKSDFLTQGPKIKEFEVAFAEYIGCEYAVAVSNGTAALHLSALALNIQSKDKVITTPITFAATANCIRYCGGEVVFADINPNTYTIDFDSVDRILSNSPKGTYKGIIPVDFAGYPIDMEAFRKLADKHGVWILEDACHAPGGYFFDSNGVKQNCGNGSFADLAIFSFHPVKHIATGEGGMITTNNKDLYEKLMLLRTHGITKDPLLLKENHGAWYYEMQELGYNYRLTDFQAALGLSQLRNAEKGVELRNNLASRYDEAFKDHKQIQIPYRANKLNHAFHLYVIQVENRLELYDYLKENGIYAQVHYIPVHYNPYYQDLGWKKGDFSIAESYYEKCLSLPMYPKLSDNEYLYIIEKVLSFYK